MGSHEPGEPAGLLRFLGLSRPQRERRQYDLQGNAATIPLPGLIHFLSSSGQTGVLWVVTAVETFELELSGGRLVYATSDAPPSHQRLGEILVREGLLEPGELTACVEEARRLDERLGFHLVRTGRIDAEGLKRALSIQVQGLFARMLATDEARFLYEAGARTATQREQLEVNLMRVLLQDAIRRDEKRNKTEKAATEVERPEPALPATKHRAVVRQKLRERGRR